MSSIVLIEQENDYPLEVWKLNNSMRITQVYDDSEGYITIQNTSSRKVALAICPDHPSDLQKEVDRLERKSKYKQIKLAEWIERSDLCYNEKYGHWSRHGKMFYESTEDLVNDFNHKIDNPIKTFNP